MGRRVNAGHQPRRHETAADVARGLPAVSRPLGDAPALMLEEQEMLARCEAAVETLKVAFWAAGKALQIVRDGRLYRATHGTFEQYVQERWDMEVRYANKLIKTWPIVEKVFEQASNDPGPIGPAQKLNQAQAWELVPVADTWDTTAAAFVYRTVAEVDGQAVTAAVLKGAVRALPSGEFDRETAAGCVRDYLALLAKESDEEEEPDLDAKVARALPYQWLRRLAQRDSDSAAAYLDRLQVQIDKARQELIPSQQGTPEEQRDVADA